MKDQPFVSIVTPVYNTEKYLTECIESVLAQTYENWEYVIVNNCSSDRSLKIAEEYAEKDSRIRIHNNEQFLDLIQNWNHALRKISPQSKYCKVVHADDWLYPECVSKMLEIAESDPKVGLVGSYRLDENIVNCDGLPHSLNVFSGKHICRQSLLGKGYFFGTPTTLLMRSILIQENKDFYNTSYHHADNEVCYKILRNWNFGFVHQVLSYTRRHNETNTTFTRRINSFILESIVILKNYGPVYLEKEEYNKILKTKIKKYNRFLGYSVFKRKGKEFWSYHKNGRQRIGYPIGFIIVTQAFLVHLYNRLLDRLKI
jgi:glycosyltransferase involved in cell wall biosynthesis